MGKQTSTWKCDQGHVLGLVSRNGRGIRQLMMYRMAIDPEASSPADVDVMAVVEGLVIDVTCSVCGGVRTWVPGEEAMRKLIEDFKTQRRKGREVRKQGLLNV